MIPSRLKALGLAEALREEEDRAAGLELVSPPHEHYGLTQGSPLSPILTILHLDN